MIRKMLNIPWIRFTVLFCVIFVPLFMATMQSINAVKEKKRNAEIEQELLDLAKDRLTTSNSDMRSKKSEPKEPIPNQSRSITTELQSKSTHVNEMSNPTQPQNRVSASVLDASEDAETDMSDHTSQDRHAQRVALAQRLEDNTDLSRFLTQLALDDATNELELMYSYLKLTPPEALYKNALRQYPDEAEEIERFFNRIENASDKTLAQIRAEDRENKMYRELRKAMRSVAREEEQQLINDLKEYAGMIGNN